MYSVLVYNKQQERASPSSSPVYTEYLADCTLSMHYEYSSTHVRVRVGEIKFVDSIGVAALCIVAAVLCSTQSTAPVENDTAVQSSSAAAAAAVWSCLYKHKKQ